MIKCNDDVTELCLIINLSSIILDADATSVMQRVALRTDDIPLGEQTVAQVILHLNDLIFIL